MSAVKRLPEAGNECHGAAADDGNRTYPADNAMSNVDMPAPSNGGEDREKPETRRHEELREESYGLHGHPLLRSISVSLLCIVTLIIADGFIGIAAMVGYFGSIVGTGMALAAMMYLARLVTPSRPLLPVWVSLGQSVLEARASILGGVLDQVILARLPLSLVGLVLVLSVGPEQATSALPLLAWLIVCGCILADLSALRGGRP